MVSIYVTIDEKGYVTGYGRGEYGVITTDPKDSHKIEIPEDHGILQGNLSGYKLIQNTLVKDTTILLKEAKEQKSNLLSRACEAHILNGFDFKINNVIYHFSYDREAQLNMQETFQMFQNEMLKTIVWTAKVNGQHVRVTLDRAVFNTIYTASLQHKQDAISRFRDVLSPVLKGLQSVEQVEALNWESQVNYPNDSAVVLKEDNTVDIQLGAVNDKTKSLQEENEMLTMSLLEVATMIMMAQLELEAARGN